MDYYPDFPGTVVEKMVFSELVAKNITFYFGTYWGDMPFTEEKKERYRPDFILPEYKIIIEVYGYYWHSRVGQYEKDALKAQMYTASGYRYYMLWDFDIYKHPGNVLQLIPELANPQIRTGHVFVADRPFDPTRSIISRLQSKPKVVRTHYRPTGRKVAGGMRGWVPHLRAPKRSYEDTDFGPMFTGFDQAYTESLLAYSRSYKDYLDNLGAWLKQHGDKGGRPEGWAYYWWFWAKWSSWWSRWDRVTDADWVAYFQSLEKYFTLYPEQRTSYWEQYYQWTAWKNAGLRQVW